MYGNVRTLQQHRQTFWRNHIPDIRPNCRQNELVHYISSLGASRANRI